MAIVMRSSDWSSDGYSTDLRGLGATLRSTRRNRSRARRAPTAIRSCRAYASIRTQEQLVRRIGGFLGVLVTERIQRTSAFGPFLLRDLQAAEHATVGGAVIAIVEERDVPACTDRLQELRAGAGTLRKLETEQALKIGRANV